MKCPFCGKELEQVKYPAGFCQECPACKGRLLSIGLLRSGTNDKHLLNDLWERASAMNWVPGRECPSCGKRMSLVKERLNGKFIELDVCTVCQNVWFDPYEFEQMPTSLGRVIKAIRKNIPIGKRRKVKSGLNNKEEWQDIDNVPDDEIPYDGKDNRVDLMDLLMGGRSAKRKPRLRRVPWVNWTIVGIMIIVYLLDLALFGSISREFGFIPAQWRDAGFTLPISFFMHSNVLFWVASLLCLVAVGDCVEDVIGHWRYFFLLLGAQLCGVIVHVCCGGMEYAYIGPGAAIAGVVTYFCLRFPQASIFAEPSRDWKRNLWRTFSLNGSDQGSLEDLRGALSMSILIFVGILIYAITIMYYASDVKFQLRISIPALAGGAVFGLGYLIITVWLGKGKKSVEDKEYGEYR